MKLKKFKHITANLSPDIESHVKTSMDILDRIDYLLDKKCDGKQKELAKALGKKESEVSKWLHGVQNFTTRTLDKLGVAFGEPVIMVCTHEEDEDCNYELAKTPYGKTKRTLRINNEQGLHGTVEYKHAVKTGGRMHKPLKTFA